jgi:hypothetical protein
MDLEDLYQEEQEQMDLYQEDIHLEEDIHGTGLDNNLVASYLR